MESTVQQNQEKFINAVAALATINERASRMFSETLTDLKRASSEGREFSPALLKRAQKLQDLEPDLKDEDLWAFMWAYHGVCNGELIEEDGGSFTRARKRSKR